MTSITNATTRAIIDYLTARGAYVWRNSTGAIRKDDGRLLRFGMVGSSDILGILGDSTGRLIAVEVKTGRDKLRPAQLDFLAAIRERGGVACVVRPEDWSDVIDRAICPQTRQDGPGATKALEDAE